MESKKSTQLNVSVTPEQAAFLAKFGRQRLTPAEIIRGLIDSAKIFYDANGWFSFPAKVEPEMFQYAKGSDPLNPGETLYQMQPVQPAASPKPAKKKK